MMVQVLITNKYLTMVYNNIIISDNELNTLRSRLFTQIICNGHFFITPEELAIVLKNFDVITSSERQCLYEIYKYYSKDEQFSKIILENLDKYVKYISEINDSGIKDSIISSCKEMAIKNDDNYMQYFNSEVINNIFISLNQVQQRYNLRKQLSSLLLLLSSNRIYLYIIFNS